MQSPKWYKNPEMLVALSALFIGLLTAIISVYSAYVDRTYARASVWPKLELSRSFSDDRFSYLVNNRGTGPAIIKYAKIEFAGQYIHSWSDIPFLLAYSQSHLHNITLPAEHSVVPIRHEGDLIPKLLEADKAITMELCYCSIYEECWTVDRSNNTTPVEQCVIKDEHAFWE